MIPFAPPYIDEDIISEVANVLRSGWITTGSKVKKFESELANYVGTEKVLCVNSATSGLELILRWFGVQEGDEVIIPAYTYSATAMAIIHCKAKPVMVDIKNDFNIDVEEIKKHVTEKTKVIMPVDIGGLPADYEEINKIVELDEIKRKFIPNNSIQKQLGRILVLSDSAHSLGAKYKGKYAGNLTDISVFSFHAVKNLTTAEGGAISLNLPKPFDISEIHRKLARLSLHGQSKDAFTKMQVGNWRYDIVEEGFKMNMPDILAAMGLVQFYKYESLLLPKRREIFEKYTNLLKNCDKIELPISETNYKKSSCHIFMVRIKGISEEERDEIIFKISQKSISVNVHFQPLPLLTFYKQNGYKIEHYPKSYDNYSREISLPVFHKMTDEQIGLVANTLLEII